MESHPLYPLLEPKKLRMLEKAGGPGLPAKLIDMFLENSPGRVAVFRLAKGMRSLPEVEAAAHSLKSSAGNLGARGLQDLAEALEAASGNGDVAASERLIGDLLETYSATCEALKAERKAAGG